MRDHFFKKSPCWLNVGFIVVILLGGLLVWRGYEMPCTDKEGMLIRCTDPQGNAIKALLAYMPFVFASFGGLFGGIGVLEAAKKNQVQGQPSIDEYSAFWYRLGALLLLLAAFFQATAQLDGMNDHEWIFVPVLLAIWISMFALVWLVGLRTDWEVYDGWKGAIIVPTFAAILALTVTFAVAVPFFG